MDKHLKKSNLIRTVKFCFWQLAETLAYISLFCIIIYSHQLGWRIYAVIDVAVMIWCTTEGPNDEKEK